MIFFCLFNFFLVKITRNYWVIIFFVAIFGLQCQYIGKSTASNVKHSRFSRKKFAFFFRILSQSASSAYVEFLGEPPSSNNVEVCFSFLWNCNIYTVDLPVDLRWTTTNKARAKGLHGAALENHLINRSCDVGEGLEMAWLFESKRVYEHLERKKSISTDKNI